MAENSLAPFRRALGDNVEKRLRVLQDNLERCLEFIDQCPIIDGCLVEDKTVASATTTDIPHRLGRTAKGAALVLQSVASREIQVVGVNGVNVSVYNDGPSDQVISLWVF